MNRSLLLLPVVAISLASCGIIDKMNRMVNESTSAIQCNRMAVDQSTAAIQRNVQAVEESNRAVQENHEQIRRINETMKEMGGKMEEEHKNPAYSGPQNMMASDIPSNDDYQSLQQEASSPHFSAKEEMLDSTTATFFEA